MPILLLVWQRTFDSRSLVLRHYANLLRSLFRQKETRAKIAEARSTAKLLDIQQYCSDFEQLLLKMWRRYENGMTPDHITE